jgi:hypothetical protein
MMTAHLGQEAFVCCEPQGELAGLGELGIDILAPLRDYVDEKYRAAVADIRAKVRDEVLQQIPTIRSEVTKEVLKNVPEIRKQVRTEAQSAVKPWVIGALSVGGRGLLAGVVALYRAKKRRRK